MTLGAADIAHILLAIAALLIAAHSLGAVLARFRQPRVIGEILGGLILGPTLFGAIAPDQQRWLFPIDGPTAANLGAIYQLGLLLLMFISGVEIRSLFRRGDQRTVAFVCVAGMIVPFLGGALLLRFIDEGRFYGPSANHTSFLLVFAIAMAVTSIPVISRIMHDLGILGTRFARIVLSVAVIEDIVLYVVLAIALSSVTKSPGSLFGLPEVLGSRAGSILDIAYHSAATVGILTLFLTLGPSVYRTTSALRFNVIRRRSPVAFQLVFMLLACIACLLLGVQPFLGAFVAGVVVGASGEGSSDGSAAIRDFAFAFFIPVYFAIVGLQLDLLHGFDPVFFGLYFMLACLIKGLSVYGGARMGGQSGDSSLHLAVAMNARGGPGIVLASVAYGAGIVNQPFFAMLVMLAILTSLLAGAWLERVPPSKLLTEDAGLGRRNAEERQ